MTSEKILNDPVQYHRIVKTNLEGTYPVGIRGRHLEDVVSDGELLGDGLRVVLLDEVWGVSIAHHTNLEVLGCCTTRVGHVVGRHSKLQAMCRCIIDKIVADTSNVHRCIIDNSRNYKQCT